jgi:hypothetical protein
MKSFMNIKTEEAPITLGRILISVRAKEILHPQDVLSALWRHAHEPWGKSFDPKNEQQPIKEDRRLVSNHSGGRNQPRFESPQKGRKRSFSLKERRIFLMPASLKIGFVILDAQLAVGKNNQCSLLYPVYAQAAKRRGAQKSCEPPIGRRCNDNPFDRKFSLATA